MKLFLNKNYTYKMIYHFLPLSNQFK